MRSNRPFHRCLGPAVAATLAAHCAALVGGDVLLLPRADARNGNDLGPVWSGFTTPPQPLLPWGDAIAHLPGCIAVSGSKGAGSVGGAVWIWRIPAEDDPLGRYGPSHVQTLRPIDADRAPFAMTAFGTSVAGGERWLFVGAPLTTIDGTAAAGAVHVFHRSTIDEPWAPFAILENPAPALGGLYGAALAFDGATLVVGVPQRIAVAGAPTTGGADVFDVGESSIGEPRSFTAPLVGGPNSHVGRQVAVAGGHVAMSDPYATIIGGSGVVIVAAADDLSIESILTTPSAQAGTLFGDSLSMQGARLAVGAPEETANGLSSAGVARVYAYDGAEWVVTHSLAGATTGAELGSVALDGDVLAVGAWHTSVDMGGFTEYGTCSLYRIERSGLTPLATAIPTQTDSSYIRYSLGQRVALGHGRWSYTETIATGPTSSRSVRSLPTAAALTDCDENGVSDLDEVLAGAPDRDSNGVPDDCIEPPAVDCDDDGVADSSSTLLAPTLPPYVGVEAVWWGNSFGSSTDRAFLWLVPREVPTGTDGVIRGVEADWVSAYDTRGQPVIVAVYDDPNQDGTPSDVVLRGAYLADVSPTAGNDRVLFPPISIGPAGTRYFLGLGAVKLSSVNATLYLRGEWVPGGPSSTWVAYGSQMLAANLNVETPQANTTFQVFTSVPDFVGVGLFHSPIDRDGNAVPDICECTADLDDDGVVGAADLAMLVAAWADGGPGDLDGDGDVGQADLAILLGMWGATCP